MNFKSTVLTGLLWVLLSWPSTAQEAAKMDRTVRRQVVDSLSSVLKRVYVYPEKANEMSKGIQKKLKKGEYDHLPDNPQLANALTRDLRAHHHDKHLVVRYDPELEKRIRKFVATSQPDQKDAEKDKKQNFYFKKAEVLPGNIGYLVFNNFADLNDLSKKTVQAAMQFVANADALILDLRNNMGGRPEMGQVIARYFFSQPQLAGKTFNRITNSWTEEWVGSKPESPDAFHLEMPIYILTSKRTYSAAEGLAYHLKHLKKAVVVGDTTRGGAHATRSFALGNGFVGFIPFSRLEHVETKTDWEGIGVVPNVAIPEDSAFLKAQELILIKLLSSTNEAAEKRKFQWLLNDLQAKTRKLALPEKTLAQYTGTFEEFQFTVEKGQLWCRNLHQKDKMDLLVPISESLFKVDNESQVEFIRDSGGSISAIRLLWNDGWVDDVNKSQQP
ncbi:S41 family peptidase [Rufibacter roseolus]|uniref:S41 family peptidase n=1 Tax=Rufibacter roseolus TaxID=2817375 RepID=UPI001B3184AA|nr:S41 family peptidase [Rufibacter roseolus]